jgi:RING finger protein 113A
MFKPRQKLVKDKRRTESSSETEESNQTHPSDVRAEIGVKKRRQGLESSGLAPESSREVKPHTDNVIAGDAAFRQSEISLHSEVDARVQYERIRDIQKKLDSGELEEGVYRGMKAYRAYIQPDDERNLMKAKVMGFLGPQRSSANIKSTIAVDYQMDICKDYKESGYCGFGDSCKFLHDRSDYKAGWQLDSEWAKTQRSVEIEKMDKFKRKAEKRKARIEKLRQDAIAQGLDPNLVLQLENNDEDSNDSVDDCDPSGFCCVCRKQWSDCETSRCVTICGHYFCESCFLSTSTAQCKACDKPTQGIFNSPQ